MTSRAKLPPPVRAGDRVGVAALSGPVEAASLERGVAALAALGFAPRLAANLTRAASRGPSSAGLFAGGDDERLAAFHELAADPEVKAIFFARGGHGSLRVLPRVDWELLARHPRAYVGYSDLTPFLNLVVARLGLVAFHGPMVAVELARELLEGERRSLAGALAGEFPVRLEVEGLAAGSDVEGPLAGGCLSLLAATLGTPFAPDLEGSILFWEDVDEPLYRLDRMLTQLGLSGRLTGLEGMVVGCVEAADAGAAQTTLDALLRELGASLGRPIARGCPSGHCCPNLTLPLGLRARLRVGSGELLLG